MAFTLAVPRDASSSPFGRKSLMPVSLGACGSWCGKGHEDPRPLPVSSQQFLFSFFFFFLLEPLPRHMEVPRRGVQSELQPPACTTATATPDPSHVGDLHHSSWQRQILNPLGEARDRTHIFMDTNGFLAKPQLSYFLELALPGLNPFRDGELITCHVACCLELSSSCCPAYSLPLWAPSLSPGPDSLVPQDKPTPVSCQAVKRPRAQRQRE